MGLRAVHASLLGGALTSARTAAAANLERSYHGSEALRGAAVAMEGGGFRALASDAGFIAGMLAVHGNLTKATLPGSGLLERFGVVSSVSGSSWFVSDLAFSRGFQSLMEAMAAAPKSAAALFRKHFMTPWLKATGVDSLEFRLLLLITHLLGLSVGAAEDTQLAVFFTLTGLTWHHFVDVLLRSTGGITLDQPLGSPVSSWARGKIWLVGHSSLLPAKAKPGRIVEGKFLGIPQVRYYAEGDVPPFLPAIFSITLGAGVNSTAPYPYVPRNSSASGVHRLVYQGAGVSVESPELNFGRGLEAAAGRLPIGGVTAASSAFLGDLPIFGPLPRLLAASLCGDFTPWVSHDNFAGELVRRVARGVTAGGVHELASAAVRGVIDGSFGDGTGISQALAVGATEVLAVLNSKSSNDPQYVQRLFPGGSQPDPQVAVLFPVFSSPPASSVRASFEAFEHLVVPEGSRFLKVLAVGSLCARTAANSFFGVEAGRSVELNVVNVCSDLTIGSLEDFNNYNDLVQEVIETLTSAANTQVVEGVLLPMMLGGRSQGCRT